MKAYFRPSPKLTIEFDASDHKELFERLAQVQEIVVHQCGKCKAQADNLIFKVRVVDDNKFYELKCAKCGAMLVFGSHRKGGTLFPKRYVEENGKKKIPVEWLPHNGWTKLDAEKGNRV